jgi:FtsH-binding integral membrane protein
MTNKPIGSPVRSQIGFEAPQVSLLQTLGAVGLSIVGFALGAGFIAVAVLVIRSILPSSLTGFTDWSNVVAPAAGVYAAFGLSQRFAPRYSPVALASLFVGIGLLSLIVSLMQPFPQPALSGVVWSLAFLSASGLFFIVPAIEAVRTSRRRSSEIST